MQDVRRCGTAPVVTEFGIDAIGPFRRLDEDEGDTGFAHGAPIDIAIPFGDVDAVHLMAVRVVHAEILRVGIGKFRLGNGRGFKQVVARGRSRRSTAKPTVVPINAAALEP